MDRRRNRHGLPVRADPAAVDAGLWDGVELMETDKLEALLKAAAIGPWAWSAEYKNGDGDRTMSLLASDEWGILSCDGLPNSPQSLGNMGRASASLIAAAPDLAAEVLRLRAENAQLVAANQALVADAVRMREYYEASEAVNAIVAASTSSAWAGYSDPVTTTQVDSLFEAWEKLSAARAALKGGAA